MERIRTALALWIIFALGAAIPLGAPADSVPSNGDGPISSPTEGGDQPQTPEIQLSPDYGPPGSTTIISGRGFTPLAGLSIYWDGIFPLPITSGAATPTVGPDGSFTLTFTVPKAAAGTHTITARDTAGLQASAAFRITPALSLSPSTGNPGDAITIEGNGFTPSATVRILWDQSAAPVESLLGVGPTVGPDGSFTLTFTVPKAAAGTHTITARDSTGLEAHAISTVKGLPPSARLTLEPSAGAPGDAVKVSGNGFAPSQAVSLYWDGAALTPGDTAIYESGALLTAGSSIHTGADGAFAVSLRVPQNASEGMHTISARDATGIEASASFEVRKLEGGEIFPPTIALSPSSGLPWDTIGINGIGFAPLASVSLFWDGTLLPSPSPGQTDTEGTFATLFSAPEASAGYHAVRAQDGTGKEASAVFFLRMVSGAAGLSVNPATGFPGDSVQITGTGFAPSSPLELLWDGVALPEGKTITAGTDGSFTATITVPPTTGGLHIINARSTAGAEATASFYVKARIGATIVLDHGSGVPGEAISISGSGFGAGRTVNLDWDEMIGLGMFPTDASGAFAGTITIPDTVAGFHLITASDAELGLDARSAFIIPSTAGPPGPAGPPGEPCSGCGSTATTTGVAGAALALAAVALGLIVLRKIKQWTIG